MTDRPTGEPKGVSQSLKRATRSSRAWRGGESSGTMPGCLFMVAVLTMLTMVLATSSSAPAQDDEGNGGDGKGRESVEGSMRKRERGKQYG